MPVITSVIDNPLTLTGHSVAEHGTVSHLTQESAEAEGQAAPVPVVNLYVSLKSKPLPIVFGAAHSGKSKMVQSLAWLLTGGDSIRCQMLNGHAWWAESSGDVSLFVEAQTRFNSAKILALIEEAWQPQNRNEVFVVCLTHISPAELLVYFSDVAFQLQHGQIMRLHSVHLTEPLHYPPNLFLIGTIDSARFDWSDEALLSKTTIIQGQPSEMKLAIVPDRKFVAHGETGFLNSLIRSEVAARKKLHRILGNVQQALHPLHLAEGLLNEQQVRLPSSVRGEMLIYLANAWSRDGIGLFDQVIPNNLSIALDLATAQILLPRVVEMIQYGATLRGQLQEALIRFPWCISFLESLN